MYSVVQIVEVLTMVYCPMRYLRSHLFSLSPSEPINIFFGVYKTDNAPIRLSYHGRIHYNSVVDPYAATIGVGLGLAGHQPGVRKTLAKLLFE